MFAKKSQQVINIISVICAAGIALGTMALIVVLSVYNGFNDLVKDLYHSFEPDLVVKPAQGKTIDPSPAVFDSIAALPALTAFCPVIEENVFLQYRNKQAIATLKGVDSVFAANTPLKQSITQGYFSIYFGEVEQAVLGRGLAASMGVNVNFIDPLWIYFPKRHAVYSAINPTASLNRDKLFPAGIFAIEQNYDSRYLFAPLPAAQRLLSYDNEVSYIELRVKPDAKIRKVQKTCRKLLGSSYVVLNRYQQNETLYKMMRTEKMAIYLILSFIVLIISCNILGSLSLLILEKKADIHILKSMGADNKLIRQCFMFEGWLIAIIGMFTGLCIGLLLCFLQFYFGFIPMPGNFAVSAYPVVVHLGDVLLVAATVLLLGFAAAALPVRRLGNN